MMKKTLLYSSLIIFLFAAAGCGQNILEGMEDKDSGDAKQYAALKSLDSGDFQSVLSACDAGTASALDCSAASLGAAGLDPLEVARQLNDLIDSAVTGDISAVGTLSGLDPSYLHEIHSSNVQLADECETTGNSDVCSQLVVTSIAEIVIAIAQVGDNDPTIDVTDGISAAEADTIGGLIASSPTVLVDSDGDGTIDNTPILEVIETSALYIINHINDSPFGDADGDGTADTELGRVIADQVETIGGADCTAGSTTCTVTALELEDYLQNTYGTGSP